MKVRTLFEKARDFTVKVGQEIECTAKDNHCEGEEFNVKYVHLFLNDSIMSCVTISVADPGGAGGARPLS